MKLPKLVYRKKAKPKGLASIGASQFYHVNIKGNTIAVIKISDDKPAVIQVSVLKDPSKPDSNPNCVFEWIFVNTHMKTFEGAKEAFETQLAIILNTRTLYEVYTKLKK